MSIAQIELNSKVCYRCKQILLVTKFHKNKHHKDGFSSHCKECTKESRREYYKNNPDKVKEYSRKHYKNNIDKVKENSRKWHKDNPEKCRESVKKYQKNHPDKVRESVKKWAKNNPDKIREHIRKQNNKRRRNLDYEQINKWFVGSEGHHIDKQNIIYLPKELHRSMYHNVFTGQNMDIINERAYLYLFDDCPLEEILLLTN